MRELSLFTGAGGGLLASHLLGWTTVCAVESDPYSRVLLRARQQDGMLDSFPIAEDVRTFNGWEWAGRVDVISGGFPCQAFSKASRGRQVATDLWPEMRRIISEVQPTWVFAENVQMEPIDRAADELEEMGYSVRCCKLGTSDVGGPTRRNRYWLVARTDASSQPQRSVDDQAPSMREVADALPWPDPPTSMGVVNGMASRMDRLRALGNGQVPRLAAVAFSTLARELVS